MNLSRIRGAAITCILGVGIFIANPGCSKHDSGTPVSAAAGEAPAPASLINGTGDADAVSAIRTELAKHWVQAADGWISEYRTQFSGLGPQQPVFVQFKDLSFQVGKDMRSEEDKQNGVEFFANCSLSNPATRWQGPVFTTKGPGQGQWTEWKTYQTYPPAPDVYFAVGKTKGVWEFFGDRQHQDLTGRMGNHPIVALWNGTPPDAGTIAKLSASAASGGSADGSAAAATVDYSPGYVSEMPTVDRVSSDMQGADIFETTARRDGAFHQLEEMMEVMSNGRIPFGGRVGEATAEELRLYQSYRLAAVKAQGDAEAKFDDKANAGLGENSPRAKWFHSETVYETGDEFRDQLLTRYFSAAWQARYRADLQAKGR